jgi:capsular exopolysaccharide synthesis family protein
VTEVSGLSVIGKLPRERELEREGAEVIWDSPQMVTMQESLRALRTNLEFLTESPRPVIQITSCVPEEGKSTVVANLGIAFSQLGIDTIVVDGDLRRPVQHEILGVENDRGLSNLLAVRNSVWARKPTRFPYLSLLPSGPLPPNSTELLHVRFRNVVERLRATKSLILIDSPPLLPVSDARVMAPSVDGVILMMTAGARRPAELKEALERLELASASVLGVVLNESGELIEGVEEYGYYYAMAADGKGAAAEAKRAAEPA